MQTQVAASPPSCRRPVTAQARGPVSREPQPDPSRRPDFDVIVREHGRALLSRAMRLTRRTSDAWDLVQDTVERALSRMPDDLPGTKVRAWLFVIMQNLHRDRCRAAGRRRFVALSDDIMTPDADEGAAVPAWRSIDLEEVHACLGQLDPRLREPYLLQVEQGLSLADIAERVGTPVATVGTRLFRARRKLRALLVVPAHAG